MDAAEPLPNRFELAPITELQYVNTPFSVMIRARDEAGNLAIGYAGTATLVDSTGTVTPVSVGPFVEGVWTWQVSIGAAADRVILSASGSGMGGTSNAFQVLTVPACPCSLWDPEAMPSPPFNADSGPVELGMKFRATMDGYVTALRFYQGISNSAATFVGHLWAADGTLLAEATYPIGTPSGWQQVALPAPVAITANTTDIVSYHTTAGYAADRSYFVDGYRSLYERPPLRALADAAQSGNSVYMYGPSGSFPSDSGFSSNYWADVVFSLDVPGSTLAAPVISAVRNGSAVELRWTQIQAGIVRYEVYRGTSPYFTGGTKLTPDVPPPGLNNPATFTDPFAVPATNYYYLVMAVGAGEVGSPPSNRTGAFYFTLTPGTPQIPGSRP